MLEFTDRTNYDDLDLRPFVQRPKSVAACIVDEPFMVSNGEAYCAQFRAGDYLCIGEHGPYGMRAEDFVTKYRPLSRRFMTGFDAFIDDAGVITLEPVE